MDFEQELRKFVHSDFPLRQTREDACWTLEVRTGALRLVADTRDLSRGGIGATLPAGGGNADALAEGQGVTLSIACPNDDGAPLLSEIFARVVWVQHAADAVRVGFAFYGLTEAEAAYIDRYLFSRIIQRNIDET